MNRRVVWNIFWTILFFFSNLEAEIVTRPEAIAHTILGQKAYKVTEILAFDPKTIEGALGHGLEIDLFLSQAKNDRVYFTYNASLFSGPDTLKIIDLSALTPGKWNRLRLWLPSFVPSQISTEVSFQTLSEIEPGFSMPALVSQTDLFIGRIAYIHANPPSEEQFANDVALGFPSLLDWPLLRFCLGGSGILILLALIYFVSRRVAVRYIIGFSMPLLAAVMLFVLQGLYLFQSLEESLIVSLRNEMDQSLQKFQSLSDTIDDIVGQELKQFEAEIKAFLRSYEEKNGKTFASQNAGSTEEQDQKKSEMIDLMIKKKIESKLEELAQRFQFNILLRNRDVSFASEYLRGLDYVSGHMSFLQKILQQEFSSYGKGRSSINESLFKVVASVRSDLQVGFREGQSLDRFIYNPGRLFDFNPIAFYERGFRKEKTFWYYFTYPEGMYWFMLGSLNPQKFFLNLKAAFRRFYAQGQKDYEYELLGQHTVESIKSSDIDRLGEMANLSLTQRKMLFWKTVEEGRAWFYVAEPYRGLRGTGLCLRFEASQIYETLRDYKNRALFFVFLFGLFLIYLIYVVTSWVVNPLKDLRSGLGRIQKGDLRTDLIKKWPDEFGNLVDLFNGLIHNLREKELVSGFLSRMAKSALGTSHSSREEVTIFFASVKNGKYLHDDWIQPFLTLVQSTVSQQGGFVDKFTGSGSLCLFRQPFHKDKPIQAALEVRSGITKLNSLREEQGLEPLQVGIGLAYGPIVLGHVGASRRKDFTCIGNTVNLAARLQYLPGSLVTTIFVDQECQKLHSGLHFLEHPPLLIKGKQEAQKVFELF